MLISFNLTPVCRPFKEPHKRHTNLHSSKIWGKKTKEDNQKHLMTIIYVNYVRKLSTLRFCSFKLDNCLNTLQMPVSWAVWSRKSGNIWKFSEKFPYINFSSSDFWIILSASRLKKCADKLTSKGVRWQKEFSKVFSWLMAFFIDHWTAINDPFHL